MNTADLEKLLREAFSGEAEKNSAEPLRIDESRRAALLGKLRTGDNAASEEFLKKQKTAGANVISWKNFILKNVGAIAACAVFGVAGALGIFAGINHRAPEVAQVAESPDFTMGSGGGEGTGFGIGRAGGVSRGFGGGSGGGESPAQTVARSRIAESREITKQERSILAEAASANVSGADISPRVPMMKSQNKLAVKGVKGNVALPDMPAMTPAAQEEISAETEIDKPKYSGEIDVEILPLKLSGVAAGVASDAPTKIRADARTSQATPVPEVRAEENAYSTFSLNVSDASFRLAAESLKQNRWPSPAEVRTEEFVNAVKYNDPPPAPNEAVSLTQEQARHPFEHNRNLIRLSVQTASAGRNARQPLNLTVLLDTSGSMERADRQETVKVALDALADNIKPGDTVGVVGFARTPRVLMNPTSGNDGAAQLRQIAGNIPPEGGTNLESALFTAYDQNRAGTRSGAQNTVLLLTDGAANLGDANPENLASIIAQNKKSGVGLNCYGIGFDNYNDAMLETLARTGNGRYAYLNNAEDAQTDFAEKLAGALQVAAKNVKVQVEFNPARVGMYRLLGYEKHRLKKEDFRNNAVAAAEIGAAESGTGVYCFETKPDGTGNVGVVRVRYQDPHTGDYREREWTIPYEPTAPAFSGAPAGVRLAGSAALFAEYLQNAENSPATLTDLAHEIAGANRELGNRPENETLLRMTTEARRLEK